MIGAYITRTAAGGVRIVLQGGASGELVLGPAGALELNTVQILPARLRPAPAVALQPCSGCGGERFPPPRTPADAEQILREHAQ